MADLDALRALEAPADDAQLLLILDSLHAMWPFADDVAGVASQNWARHLQGLPLYALWEASELAMKTRERRPSLAWFRGKVLSIAADASRTRDQLARAIVQAYPKAPVDHVGERLGI